ncbi:MULTISPECIES: helix-turn-helix domain-containing protein [unclassified Arcicella]|uniref:helix-turn-helix domain-containing protein n=1 Tax=unclassified Arcicella TaxID=2644986 RepID=UPI002856B93A|nr:MULTISPECIES: helix-turn-helix domain-containing protein [unclassified Arcicella]MDR6564629.1 transcriptional regulator with XRE-family HTH domain [Arcicella sp. BE51]MDR6814443.1 transcriptional regulator with XRE-family HTH domain [Arcicella sp. BE140]MDR6825801.1 transcriptional regulator with XRE-family HTH domain [Arcicella sp. BE139]
MNIKELRIQFGLSQQELAEKVGIPRGRINGWEQRGSKPKVDDHKKLEDFFIHLSKQKLTDIQKEEAEIIGNLEGLLESENVYKTKSGNEFVDIGNGKIQMNIPLVEHYAYAGYLTGWGDSVFLEELPKHSIIVDKHYRGIYRAFQVRGDSMDNNSRDSICSGDVVVGRSVDKKYWKNKFYLHKWEDYVIIHEGGILVKRITDHWVEQGIIICMSLNTDKSTYPNLELHLSEVYEIYNVVEVSRKRG